MSDDKLMDFDEEEEEEDDQQDLLSKPVAPAPAEDKKSKSLMDFGEEEDDDNDDLLKPKRKTKMVQDDEDEEEEEEESEEVQSRAERDRETPGSPKRDDGDGDDVDAEEDYDMEEDFAESGERIESITVPDMRAYVPKRTTKCYYTQLPRFLYIAGGAFDEDRYNFEKERQAIKTQNGDQLIGDEIVRWRVKRDESGSIIFNDRNEPELESNTRVVEYDDGTFQLFVGEEAVDLKLASTSNEFMYARVVEGEDRTCFQALARFEGQASFRPSGPDSKQQKAIELMVKKQQVKAISMKDTNPTEDPEQEQDKKIKENDERYRKRVRRRNRAENTSARKRRAAGGDDWNTAYLEKDEPARSKKKKSGSKRRLSDEEEEEEDEEEEDEMNSFIATSSEDDEDDE